MIWGHSEIDRSFNLVVQFGSLFFFKISHCLTSENSQICDARALTKLSFIGGCPASQCSAILDGGRVQEGMVPVEDWVKTRDEKKATSHGGKDVHVFFGWVLIVIIGRGEVLLDEFFFTDLCERSSHEFLSVVVDYCFRYLVSLDKSLE